MIDASDPKIEEKIEVVNSILEKIWASQTRIHVLNKIDQVSDRYLEALKKWLELEKSIYISSQNKEWFDELTQTMLDYAQ